MNNIKDINKLKIGQILSVNPEADFSNNPRGGYSNDHNDKSKTANYDHIAEVASNFVSGGGDENTIIKGKALSQVRNLESVNNLIETGFKSLMSDGKLTPGEAYKGAYSIGKATGANGQRIVGQSILDVLTLKKAEDITFFQAENILGSFGFSMRVNADGKSVSVCVYDQKTIESLSDHKAKGNRTRKEYAEGLYMSPTY